MLNFHDSWRGCEHGDLIQQLLPEDFQIIVESIRELYLNLRAQVHHQV